MVIRVDHGESKFLGDMVLHFVRNGFDSYRFGSKFVIGRDSLEFGKSCIYVAVSNNWIFDHVPIKFINN